MYYMMKSLRSNKLLVLVLVIVLALFACYFTENVEGLRRISPSQLRQLRAAQQMAKRAQRAAQQMARTQPGKRFFGGRVKSTFGSSASGKGFLGGRSGKAVKISSSGVSHAKGFLGGPSVRSGWKGNRTIVGEAVNGGNDVPLWPNGHKGVDMCKKVCGKRPDCKGVTYNNKNGSCWLKTNVNGRAVNKDWTTEIRDP